MQSKKKDKKKFKRKNIKISNIKIHNLEDFYDDEIVEEKKAVSKLSHKMETSSKSGLNLKKGRIIEIQSNYRSIVQVGKETHECVLGGRLKQLNERSKHLLAVGDYVNVDFTEKPRIEEIMKRKNVLSRFSEENFQYQLILASNIDQVIITTSFKQPELNFGLIDRFICMAALYNITPVICVNKYDLVEEGIEQQLDMLDFYSSNGIKIIITSTVSGKGINELKEVLKNKDSVFSGHSGAGKSSLINSIEPDLNLKVGDVSESSQKGTHTTTSSRLIAWSFGGYLVDTPGIKTFGFKREDSPVITKIFPGFVKYYDKCNFKNCSHIHEKDCAVKNAIENGLIPEERYFSYLRIMESLEE